MPSIAPDAEFFDLIHSLLDDQLRAGTQERRAKRRHRYDCVQLLAPYDGHRMPSQAAFRPVRCHDISPRGFSFYANAKPAFTHVVAAFGSVPFTFFTAQVRYVRAAEEGKSGEFLVGCELRRRIVRSERPPESSE